MRKQTRYNPTRGGKNAYHPLRTWLTPTVLAAIAAQRLTWPARSLPLPRPLQDVLANCPRHDSPQDRPR
jgi:hypothetical protein